MKRQDIYFGLSMLLLLSVLVTGLLGYLQSQLELRQFIPHRYAAYFTLFLAGIHVFLNAGKIWRYFKVRVPRVKKPKA